MIIRFATLLLLCSASLPLLANEGHPAPDGEGECPSTMHESPGASATRDEADATPGETGSQSAREEGDAESSGRGPRMHNLLPGMFR